jgi:hypothetical protein
MSLSIERTAYTTEREREWFNDAFETTIDEVKAFLGVAHLLEELDSHVPISVATWNRFGLIFPVLRH